MKKFSLLLIFVFSCAFAQEKLFTIEDVVFNSYSKFAPETIRGIKFINDEGMYSFVENNKLMVSSADNENIDEYIDLSVLNSKLSEIDEKELRYFPNINWEGEDNFSFWNGNSFFNYNADSGKLSLLIQTETDAANKTLSPDNKKLAYTVDNNLRLTLNTKEIIAVSDENEKNIIYGQSVHRNEFGISGGIFWSPKSNYLAFYRMDQTMVTDFPLVDLTTTPATLVNEKYPMAGQTSHHVTLGIINLKTKETVYLKTGKPKDQYLTTVTWGPDEKFIYVSLLSRDQKHLKLVKFDAASGSQVKVLFEEKDEQYVEPENSLKFVPGSNDKFLWFSERDGFNHLYLYNTDGELLKPVTSGNYPVLSFYGFDKDGENIYFTANKEHPTQVDFYCTEISSGSLKRLTKGEGTHRITASPNNVYFVDRFNSVTVPGVISILNNEGEKVKELLVSQNPISDYKTGNTKLFELDGENGIKLQCRMITPPDFDETKKYPVIFYVYGGPHAQLVTNSWGYGRYAFWFQFMAQNGYIVFTLDNRGSANRGIEFEQAVHRQLGKLEVADQMVGVEYLKSLPYVDQEKFGVFGWSYGGFMTTSLMLKTNDTFKVGVGGGAVIDWKYYEVMYTERYMDDPQTNPDGFEESNLLNHVDKLNGKLLLVHGTNDPVVVWQHTLNFAKKAANLNKPLDYYPYPGHGHGVGGKDALHLYTKISNYFLDNLK